MSYSEQLNRILSLADSSAGASSPDYFVAPETALPSGMWEDQLSTHPQSKAIEHFLQKHPSSAMLIGAATNKFYPDSNLRSLTARRFTDADDYYDSYNSALQYGGNDSVQVYHKSKLVPGVEKMPFPWLFSHIEDLAIDLGGITGSLGVQQFPSVFTDTCKHRNITPVICYESIYGDYISQAVRNYAGLIFIITNDGWWGDTPGYKQHRLYASLRAIEFRRSIARSANTGISCLIDQKGDEVAALGWWKADWLRGKINYNNKLTFYAKHGDYIGSLAMLSSILIMVLFLVNVFKRKNPI